MTATAGDHLLAVLSIIEDANALTAIFGIAALVAASVSGLVWGNQKTLRDSNTDLRDRVNDLEKNQARLEAKNKILAAENATLARHITGEAHWEALNDVMDTRWQQLTEVMAAHQKQAETHWTAELTVLRQMAEGLTKR